MLKTLNTYIQSVAFSPDGTKIASGGGDNTVRLWDLASGTGKIIGRHDGIVYSVAFSPNGKKIASGGRNKIVKLWDLASGMSQIIGMHDNIVLSVAFSPDGNKIASGGGDNTVRLWDVNSLITEERDHNELTNETRQIIGKHFDGVNSIAFSPDGTKIISGGDDNTVRLWDLTCLPLTLQSNVNSLKTLERDEDESNPSIVFKHRDNVMSVAFSPDGKKIASGGLHDYLKLWDFTCLNHQIMGYYDDWFYSIAFSPDSKRIVYGGWDSTIRLWDLSSGKSQIIGKHDRCVSSVAFSPDNKKIISGGWNGIRIWINPFWVRDIKKSLC